VPVAHSWRRTIHLGRSGWPAEIGGTIFVTAASEARLAGLTARQTRAIEPGPDLLPEIKVERPDIEPICKKFTIFWGLLTRLIDHPARSGIG
jgi:hypothetical protein